MSNLFKKFTWWDFIIILGFICIILPFIVLAKFDHPSADDFEYTNNAVYYGFLSALIHNYMHWQGRFFSTAFLSINPLVFRSLLFYKFIPILLLLALGHALYLLIYELTIQYSKKREVIVIALTLLTLYLWRMSSISTGFYWLAGAITYQVPNILMIYLCAYIVRLHRAQQLTQIILDALLSVIFVFAIVGSNETSMALCLLLLLSIFGLSLYRNHKVNWILFSLVIAAFTASYIVIVAPGNYVRLAAGEHHLQGILPSIKSSIISVLKNIFRWAALLPMAGFTVVFIPFAAQLAENKIKQKNSFFVHPAFSVAVLLVLLVAGFIPGYMVYKWDPPARAINVMDLLIVLGWFINVYILVEYSVRKHKKIFTQLPRYAALIICVFSFLSFFKDDSNIRTAYFDLLSGRAARYDKELTDRYKIITESKNKNCIVAQLKKPPETIFFDDITFDAKDWRNVHYARYFHKDMIALKTPERSTEKTVVEK